MILDAFMMSFGLFLVFKMSFLRILHFPGAQVPRRKMQNPQNRYGKQQKRRKKKLKRQKHQNKKQSERKNKNRFPDMNLQRGEIVSICQSV